MQSVVARPAANTERQLAARRKGRCLLPVSAPILVMAALAVFSERGPHRVLSLDFSAVSLPL